MNKSLYFFACISVLSIPARANDAPTTECASRVFADALARTANTVDETAHETDIQTWIYQTFALPDVLNDVLACPEMAHMATMQLGQILILHGMPSWWLNTVH